MDITISSGHLPQGSQGKLALTPQVISVDLPRLQSLRDSLGLCQSVRELLASPDARASIVCFVGIGNDEATNSIAFQTAVTAARQIDLRVLLVDAVADRDNDSWPLLGSIKLTLNEALRTGVSLNEAFVSVRDTRLTYTCLAREGEAETALANLDLLKSLMSELAPFYDLILINGLSVIGSAFGLELTKMANGTVLVIEADKTRSPVAKHAKSVIEGAGGRVIGAVLNNRRHYIPRFLYRWL